MNGNGDYKGGGHRHGSKVPQKTTFPKHWDDDKVIAAIEETARNPDEPPIYNERDNYWKVRGTCDGVKIGTIVQPDGQIVAAFPIKGEGLHRNDRNGEPRAL